VLDSPEGAAIRRMYGESIDGRPFDVVLAHDWVEKSCNKNFFEAVKIFLGLEIKNYNITLVKILRLFTDPSTRKLAGVIN